MANIIQWEKWSTSSSTNYWYERQSTSGNSISQSFDWGNSESTTLYQNYSFSSSSGFSVTSAISGTTGPSLALYNNIIMYKVSNQVLYQQTSWDWSDDDIITVYYAPIEKAVRRSSTSYLKGSTDYGAIYAEEGTIPEGGSLYSGSATGSYCIATVNGTKYYYQKVGVASLTINYSGSTSLGTKTGSFSLGYSISGANVPSATVVEKLDDVTTRTYTAMLGTTYYFQKVNASNWSSISNGSHTLKIEAYYDAVEATSKSIYFTKAPPNTAPVINYSGSTSLGNQNLGFNLAYSVSDADGDSVTVVEKLDDTTVRTYSPTLGTTQYFEKVQSANWNTIDLGAHTLKIEATDGELSAIAKTITFTKTNTNPVINYAGDINLGDKSDSFAVSYSITDAESDAVTVTEKLDNAVVRTYTVALNEEQTFEGISSKSWSSVDLGEHTITIEATDGNATATPVNITFTKVNLAPVINYVGEVDLGDKTDGFVLNYSISDYEGDSVTVTEKLNNAIVRTYTATLGEEQYFEMVLPENWSAIDIGTHMLTIEATDYNSEATPINVTFTKFNTAPIIIYTGDTELGILEDGVVLIMQIDDSEEDDITIVEKLNNEIKFTEII